MRRRREMFSSSCNIVSYAELVRLVTLVMKTALYYNLLYLIVFLRYYYCCRVQYSIVGQRPQITHPNFIPPSALVAKPPTSFLPYSFVASHKHTNHTLALRSSSCLFRHKRACTVARLSGHSAPSEALDDRPLSRGGWGTPIGAARL